MFKRSFCKYFIFPLCMLLIIIYKFFIIIYFKLILSTKHFCCSEKILRGSEFPVVVHFSADINGEHVEEIYSRCKSRLFVICHTRNVDRVFPTEARKKNAANFVQITDISGEYL